MTSAITIGGAYAAGGFVPLAPYMLLAMLQPHYLSQSQTLAALFILDL